MAKYGMVVDLERCTGCGACVMACKAENNVPRGIKWANYELKVEGEFPNVKYEYVPTQCNHCDNAPCVEGCPAKGDALYYSDNGMTLLNPDECIQCRACVDNCPYGQMSFNDEEPHQFWRDELGEKVSAAAKSPEIVPYYNPNRGLTYQGIRGVDYPEKCTFCDHRVLTAGKEPACVEACPCKARLFGDLENPNCEARKHLDKFESHDAGVLDANTEPNVYYVKEY